MDKLVFMNIFSKKEGAKQRLINQQNKDVKAEVDVDGLEQREKEYKKTESEGYVSHNLKEERKKTKKKKY